MTTVTATFVKRRTLLIGIMDRLFVIDGVIICKKNIILIIKS